MLCHPGRHGKERIYISSSTTSRAEMFAVLKKATGEGKKCEAEEECWGAHGAGERNRGGRYMGPLKAVTGGCAGNYFGN